MIIKAFKGFKKFSGGGWWVGGVESDYSVCPRPLCWIYACFTPVYIGRDRLSGTPLYIGIRRFTLVGRDVELDNFQFYSKELFKNSNIANLAACRLVCIYHNCQLHQPQE